MIVSIEQINNYLIAINKKEFSDYSSKKLMIDLYESLSTIKVCDTAYPIEWADCVRQAFNIKDIGDWCWAYGPDASHGIPLPCNDRALVLLELMIHLVTDKGLIYMYNYIEKPVDQWNIKEKRDFIESYGYKVQIGTEHVQIYDPLDEEWKLVGEFKDLDQYMNETIEMIKS